MSFRRRHAVFLLFWGTAVLYLGLRADRGWIPHDEGQLGQMAERSLAGELPHRDFDDTYTGGLSLFYGAAFALFGVKLTVLRHLLLLFSAAFLAALYALARRFAGPWACGFLLWVATAWSLPVYFAGLPSWYNLFFATFGALALFRHLEDGRRRWLAAAGLCAGISCLWKSIGLLFVAAGLLFLVYREQLLAQAAQRAAAGPRQAGPRQAGPRQAGFRLATGATLALFCGLLLAVIPKRPMELLHFAAPGVALGLFLIWHGRRTAGGSGGARWRRLLGLTLPFLAGAALPVASYLVPYAASGTLGELYHGVFILPLRRLELAAKPLPALWTLVTAAPMAWLLSPRKRRAHPALVAVCAAAAGLVAAFGYLELVYLLVWTSVRPLVPLVVFAGLWLLIATGDHLDDRRRQQLFLALALAGLLSLVQHPYPFGVYFAYAAPAVALAIFAVLASQRAPRRPLAAVAAGFYLLFALLWLHRGWVQAVGVKYWPITYDAVLDLERGGLRVQAEHARTYERMVAEVRRRSAEGSFIYATPDCPEVYFLSARKNPTGTLYDLYEDDYFDSGARSARLLALLDEHAVEVVVFNRSPQFSFQLPGAFIEEVGARFPGRADVLPYSIHWRELLPLESRASVRNANRGRRPAAPLRVTDSGLNASAPSGPGATTPARARHGSQDKGSGR